jgi:hypothetical protein
MTPVFAVADASFFVLRDFATCFMRREGAERSAAGAATEGIKRDPKHRRVLRRSGLPLLGVRLDLLLRLLLLPEVRRRALVYKGSSRTACTWWATLAFRCPDPADGPPVDLFQHALERREPPAIPPSNRHRGAPLASLGKFGRSTPPASTWERRRRGCQRRQGRGSRQVLVPPASGPPSDCWPPQIIGEFRLSKQDSLGSRIHFKVMLGLLLRICQRYWSTPGCFMQLGV